MTKTISSQNMNQFLLDSFVSYCKMLDAGVKQQLGYYGVKIRVPVELERLSDVMHDAMTNCEDVCFLVSVEDNLPATVHFNWDGTLAGMVVGKDPLKVMSGLERYAASIIRFLPDVKTDRQGV